MCRSGWRTGWRRPWNKKAASLVYAAFTEASSTPASMGFTRCRVNPAHRGADGRAHQQTVAVGGGQCLFLGGAGARDGLADRVADLSQEDVEPGVEGGGVHLDFDRKVADGRGDRKFADQPSTFRRRGKRDERHRFEIVRAGVQYAQDDGPDFILGHAGSKAVAQLRQDRVAAGLEHGGRGLGADDRHTLDAVAFPEDRGVRVRPIGFFESAIPLHRKKRIFVPDRGTFRVRLPHLQTDQVPGLGPGRGRRLSPGPADVYRPGYRERIRQCRSG